MKIHIMTDMEGCAGIMNAQDYIYSGSAYYEYACELATLEVSAAVEGALEAGATEVLVVDAHGPGAMKRSLLHPRARLLGGRPWPKELVTYGCDGSFDAALMIGQHAMSGTDGGHLSHTMSFEVAEYRVNDIPMGELGLFMLVAGYFAVPLVMVSGDEAACAEARALVPNIETCEVKSGMKRGSSHGLTGEENARFNSMATHLHPDEARARIREHAFRAVRRIPEIAPYRLEAPYTLTIVNRPSSEKPKVERFVRKGVDYLDLMRQLRGAGAPEQKTKPAGKAAAAATQPASKPRAVASAKPPTAKPKRAAAVRRPSGAKAAARKRRK
jgi:D-amino peptidase